MHSQRRSLAQNANGQQMGSLPSFANNGRIPLGSSASNVSAKLSNGQPYPGPPLPLQHASSHSSQHHPSSGPLHRFPTTIDRVGAHSLNPVITQSHNGPPNAIASSSQQSQQRPNEQTVQQILALGAERNMQASQMMPTIASASGSRHSNTAPSLVSPTLKILDKAIEETWVAAGRAAEVIGDWRRALSAYETALRRSPFNTEALTQTANILRQQEKFVEAAEYFTRVVHLVETAGEVWGALGHCYLMIDDLAKAYACYQQAIHYIPDAKNEPKLWYGIGILYDRYGSLEHAEEAFASVINTDPHFEKANEIYFRLGIIYKQQKNSTASLQCFKYILHNPPRPLTDVDIWFQIGHVYEQQQDFEAAKDAYERVLHANPTHAKVLQQLGGLYHRRRAPFYDPNKSVDILTRSLEHDGADPFSWYLLGRAYMKGGNYGKAYEAYQQAVYRDGKNPAFWCSIGLLYYQINQFHDALDAYSRAIKVNPYIAEVWHNLGALYESCHDQLTDAIDAYHRCLTLDAGDDIIRQRLDKLQASASSNNRGPLSPPPAPRDISPLSDSWILASTSAQPPMSPLPAPPPSRFAPDVANASTLPSGSTTASRAVSGLNRSGNLGTPDEGRRSPAQAMRDPIGARPSHIAPNGHAFRLPSVKSEGRSQHALPDHGNRKSPSQRIPPLPLGESGRRASGISRPSDMDKEPMSPRSIPRDPHYPDPSTAPIQARPNAPSVPLLDEFERGRPAHGFRPAPLLQTAALPQNHITSYIDRRVSPTSGPRTPNDLRRFEIEAERRSSPLQSPHEQSALGVSANRRPSQGDASILQRMTNGSASTSTRPTPLSMTHRSVSIPPIRTPAAVNNSNGLPSVKHGSNPPTPSPSASASRKARNGSATGARLPSLPLSGNRLPTMMTRPPSPSQSTLQQPGSLVASARQIDDAYDDDVGTDGLMALASAAAPSPAVNSPAPRPTSAAEIAQPGPSRKRSLGEVSNSSEAASTSGGPSKVARSGASASPLSSDRRPSSSHQGQSEQSEIHLSAGTNEAKSPLQAES